MNHRISDIQLLRGIAVIFVLIEHSMFNLFKETSHGFQTFYAYFGGWTGVDLFFAISGFVIARDLVPRLRPNEGRQFTVILSFWIRRASRLWPSAWLWLMIILLATFGFNQSGGFGLMRDNLDATLAGVFNYGNFRLIETYSRTPYGTSFPYWSLSLEEQFYFLLPLVALILRRWLPLALLIAVVVQFFVNRHIDLIMMLTRSDAIMLGVLLALWSSKESYKRFEPTFLKNKLWLRWAILLTLTIGLGALGSRAFATWRFWVGSVALLSVSLVFIASYDQDYLMPDNPLKKIFLWFGSRSYALYLTHIPAYIATHEIFHRILPTNAVVDQSYNVYLGLTAMSLCAIASELNYRYVEAPFRIWGKRFADGINFARPMDVVLSK